MEHSLASNSHSNGYHHIPDHGFGDADLITSSSAEDDPLDLPRNNSPIHAAGNYLFMLAHKAIFIIFHHLLNTGAMPIPLDIANLASSHLQNDVGTLDLANLNSSSQNELQPLEEPDAGVAQVNYWHVIIFFNED